MTSEERHEARYRRRKRKRQMKRWMRSQAVGTLEEVFNYRDMFYWGKKCCNGVRWKQSTQNFELHLLSGTAKRRRLILEGKWKPKKCAHFTLHERGKVRPIDAPHIEDRPLTNPFRFCKARFTLTETGKIKVNGCRDGVKRARRKLKLFHRQFLEGKKTLQEIDQYMESQTSYYRTFNDHGRLLKLRRMHYAIFNKYREAAPLKMAG